MCAYFGIVQAFRSHERQSWPQVDAVVLESEALFTGGQGEGGGNAEVKMLVEYLVQQTAHQALVYAKDVTKVDYIPPRYDVGRNVTIHYDPADPSSPVFQFPSVVSSLVVVLISLIPILPAMLFIVFWIAMGFSRWKISQARRHLSHAVQEADQFNQTLEQYQADGRTIPAELLAQKSQLVRQVEEIHALLIGLQDEIDDLTPPPEENAPTATAAKTPDVKLISTTFSQRIVLTAILAGLPLGLGYFLTGWAPYYSITCQRHEDNHVDCQLQQVLFGFLQYREAEALVDLHEVDYEMKGEIRKKRAFLRLTGESTKQICAGRAAFTSKSIQRFLNDTNRHRLQVSDGHAILGLYLPYFLAMVSAAALILIHQKGPLPSSSVAFAIGSLVAGGIALLPFVYLCDIRNASVQAWLLLVITFLAGGIINVIRQPKVF